MYTHLTNGTTCRWIYKTPVKLLICLLFDISRQVIAFHLHLNFMFCIKRFKVIFSMSQQKSIIGNVTDKVRYIYIIYN